MTSQQTCSPSNEVLRLYLLTKCIKKKKKKRQKEQKEKSQQFVVKNPHPSFGAGSCTDLLMDEEVMEVRMQERSRSRVTET